MPRTHLKKWSPEECKKKHVKNERSQNLKSMLTSNGIVIKNFLPPYELQAITEKARIVSRHSCKRQKDFKFLNKEGAKNMRMLLFNEEDGYLPHYRTSSVSYGNPLSKIKKMDATVRAPEWLKIVAEKMEKCLGKLIILSYIGIMMKVDKIGAHHDKTQDLSIGSSIFCLSLASSRKFRVSANKKDKWTDKNINADFIVEPNDCVQLKWDTNQVYRHEIVPSKKFKEVRYSITARSKCTMFNPSTGSQNL